MLLIFIPVVIAIVVILILYQKYSSNYSADSTPPTDVKEVSFYEHCDYRGHRVDIRKDPDLTRSIRIPEGQSVTLVTPEEHVTYRDSVSCIEKSFARNITGIKIHPRHHHHHHHDDDNNHHHHHDGDHGKSRENNDHDNKSDNSDKGHGNGNDSKKDTHSDNSNDSKKDTHSNDSNDSKKDTHSDNSKKGNNSSNNKSQSSIRTKITNIDITHFLDNIDVPEIIDACKKDATSPFHSVGNMQPGDFVKTYIDPLRRNVDTVSEELNDLIDLMTTISTMSNPTVENYCNAFTSSALLKTIFGSVSLKLLNSICMKSQTLEYIKQVQTFDRDFFSKTCPEITKEMASNGLPKNAENLKTLLCGRPPIVFEPYSGGDSVPTPPANGDVPSPWTPLADGFAFL